MWMRKTFSFERVANLFPHSFCNAYKDLYNEMPVLDAHLHITTVKIEQMIGHFSYTPVSVQPEIVSGENISVHLYRVLSIDEAVL